MTKMSDLSPGLVVKILTRIPITSLRAVRSTCKLWKALSLKYILGKAAATRQQQFLGFMTMGSKVCSLRFSLQGEMVDPSIKPIALFNQVKISKVFHCDGLVLCVAKDNSKLVLWNPYLGQTRWILPRRKFQRSGNYALGYADHNNNHNHKILRLTKDSLQVEFEIYDVSSSLWSVLELNTDWTIERRHRGVTMKGNAYFFALFIFQV